MVEYIKSKVKLPDSQLNKLKPAVKNRKEVTLGMNIRMFEGNNLLHELLFTTRQNNKLRNAFENNISADIELPKTEISEISQSGGFQVHY